MPSINPSFSPVVSFRLDRIRSALTIEKIRLCSVLAILTVATLYTLAPPAATLAAEDHSSRRSEQWVGTWSASPQSGFLASDFNNQSLRMMIHCSIGGRRVRLRFSNTFGTVPLRIEAVHVAIRSAGPAIVAGTDRPVSFNGNLSVTIPPGALVVSDAVALAVPALSDIAVSVFLNGNAGPATSHNIRGLSYLAAGDATASVDAAPYTARLPSWFFLTGVEVVAAKHADAIVALGDSITDGDRSTPDTNSRWPDELARRLISQHTAIGVLNQGIAGNRILKDSFSFGPNALSRFDRDVLAQTGVRFVIVLEGINDIGTSSVTGDVSAAEIIAGLRQLALRAHARGLTIFGATLTPFEGATIPGFFSQEGEIKRETINEFLRTTRTFDGVIDFDKAMRDPTQPTQLLPSYDSGDHLHPSDAGYKAMGDAVDLALFRGDGEPDRQ